MNIKSFHKNPQFNPSYFDLSRIHAIHSIVSILHKQPSRDWRRFDLRSYAIQFPVRSIDDLGKVHDAAYLKVREAFDHHPDAKTIGMVIAGDVNGTRSHTVGQWDRMYPHLHALVILPSSLEPNTFEQEELMMARWRKSIENLDEVPHISNISDPSIKEVVDIRLFEGSGLKILDYEAYVKKADTSYASLFGENVSASYYPYDNKLKSRGSHIDFENQSIRHFIFLLHLFPEKILKRRAKYSLTPFQRAWRKEYEDAETTDEKTQVKDKFLRFVAPYTENPACGFVAA